MDYKELINKNVIKILEALERDKLYFNQIQEITKIKSKNNLLKNLNNLVEMNLLKKDKNKSNTFYSINYENNISLSLLDLVNKIKFQKIPFEKRKAIEEYIMLLKPNIAILFGSIAKETSTKKSDVDLLFVYDKIPKINYEDISERYGIKISLLETDFEELKKGNKSINHILLTGYPLIGSKYFYKILNEIK
jgi:predicted nucleotidyltransferase